MKLIRCFHCDTYTTSDVRTCKGCGAELVDYGQTSQIAPGFVLRSSQESKASGPVFKLRLLRQIEWKAVAGIAALVAVFFLLKRGEVIQGFAKFMKSPDENLLSAAGVVLVGIILLIAVLVYCLPTIIASRKRHSQSTAISVLNILFGWTLVGYAVALVWSLTESRANQKGC
jgi:hypothetical protein